MECVLVCKLSTSYQGILQAQYGPSLNIHVYIYMYILHCSIALASIGVLYVLYSIYACILFLWICSVVSNVVLKVVDICTVYMYINKPVSTYVHLHFV